MILIVIAPKQTRERSLYIIFNKSFDDLFSSYVILSHLCRRYLRRSYQNRVEKENRTGNSQENFSLQQRIKVFKDWHNGAEEIDPKTISWDKIESHNFTYKFRQDPGPSNPMGRIKFMLPNKFSVYLHDTPGRSLFKETNRVFSSRCIRIEKPIDLALYLLKNDPNWSRDKLMEAVEDGKPTVIWIQNPITVYLQYWTAWVDEFGDLNFREDIYHRDGPLDRALKEQLSGQR
jgi:murein L,D-transpeptidase YcbB/YkuD